MSKRIVLLLTLMLYTALYGMAQTIYSRFTVGFVEYGVLSDTEAAVTNFRPEEKITSFTLPETVTDQSGKKYKVTTICSHAFAGASSVKPIEVNSLTLPSSIVNISASAFRANIKIKNLTIKGKAAIADMAFASCTGLESITFGPVSSIGKNAFYNTGLTSVKVPNVPGGIGEAAFAGCEQLKSVTFDNKVSALPNGCFRDCPLLNNITIPVSITELPDNCFSGCTGLGNITLHDQLYKVGNSCFRGCKSLTHLPQPHHYSSGDYAFAQCLGLTEVNVCNTGRATFSSCVNITKATITGYTGPYPLQGCDGITRLDITGGGSLGEAALSGMKNLKEIYCYSTQRIPTTAEYYTATAPDWVYENVKLYVPEGCKKEYITDGDNYAGKSAWKNFKNISETISNSDLLRNIYIPDATVKVGEILDIACEVSPVPWTSSEFYLYSDDIFTVLACGYTPGYSYWSPGYLVGQAPGTTTVHFYDVNSGLQTSFKVTVVEDPENPDYLTGLHTMTYSRGGISSGSVPDILPKTFKLGLINNPQVTEDYTWEPKYSIFFSGILNPDVLLDASDLEVNFDNGAVTAAIDVLIKDVTDDGIAAFWYWNHDNYPFKIYKKDGVLRMSDGVISGWIEHDEPTWSVSDQWGQEIIDIHEVGVDSATDIYRDDMSSCVNYRLTGNRLEFETSGDIYVYTHSGNLHAHSHSDNIVIDTPGFYIVRFNNAAFKIAIP